MNISAFDVNVITDPTIVAMVSGGADSVGMLYQLLADPLYDGISIHAHHIHLKNQEHRDEAEAVAARGAVQWLRQNGHSLTYSESTMECPSFNGNFLWDVDIINFMAGNILSWCPMVLAAALGKTQTDDDHGLPDYLERRQRGINMFTLYVPLEKKLYPVGHLTKQEVYERMPEGLRQWTWTCRTPVKTPEGFRECGKCRSCHGDVPWIPRTGHILPLTIGV